MWHRVCRVEREFLKLVQTLRTAYALIFLSIVLAVLALTEAGLVNA